ncbi:MAG: DUF1800 domain-containing protein [Actinomycetota bacterium]|nr:DUF1800 domain-containing protein [Actinomycetota bacterium]
MDHDELTHLLRRTEFVVRPERVTELSALSRADAVANILDVGQNGTPALPVYFQSEHLDHGWEQYVAACSWWLDRMVNTPRPMQEKMTLFWHGHFTSAWWDVGKGYHMMLQNHLYRQYALGDFRQLTQKMALEPAMLVYLSNAVNVKGEPNQNFARELMELFTLGVGNYTEADVDASARAWTGHNADWPAYVYQFRSSRHDNFDKTFFGTTKNWDGPDIIDEILRDNPTKKVVAARFIVKKLWQFFAHLSPPATLVEELADVFLATTPGPLDLQQLMQALLTRDEFYSTTARTGLVRTPIEWFAALSFYTGLNGDNMGVAWAAEATGQQFFQPPNVSGWRPNGYWLNTSALNGRAQIARSATWRLRDQHGFDEVYDMTAAQAVDYVAQFFGIHPLSTATRDALITGHQAALDATPWVNWWAATNLLTMILLTPEFHMA